MVAFLEKSTGSEGFHQVIDFLDRSHICYALTSFTEAIRLQEQMDEEQRAQIARDEEIARQWDEEEGKRAMSEAKSSKKIDWNDPSVI
ncbi:hypothetical protein Tco_0062359, partial [Tanacetum coccineum]